MNNLLLVTILLPLAGAVAMIGVAQFGRQYARIVALLVSLVTLGLAASLIKDFPADGVTEPVHRTAWPLMQVGAGATLDIGLDGLGIWLFGLSALLMLTAVLVSWEAIRDGQPLFYGMLLLLEFGCLGVFAAQDMLLFYVFFEFTLIPLFFLIGIWGSEDRRYAAVKFFLYTLAGSVLTFLGLLMIAMWHWQFTDAATPGFGLAEITRTLAEHPLPVDRQLWIFLALFAGFAIKVPLFPFHSWLPLAHVQAPAAGSVFLAGVLLKMGVYGFLRFSVPMLPDATMQCMPWLLWLSVIGIVYGALVALAQRDMKRLIAYSSVSHLGFCTLGLFALNRLGVQGAALQLVNHGLSTGGLFAIIGMIYERYHTREISQLGGLSRKLPWLAFFMLVFTFSSIGLPGLNGFAGELLILIGMFQRGFAEGPALWQTQFQTIAVIAVSGVVLGAWYMLWMVQRTFFGPLKEPRHEHEPSVEGGAASGEHDDGPSDLKPREILALVPLVVFVVWIGLAPDYFLRRMAPTLNELTAGIARPLQERFVDSQPTSASTEVGELASTEGSN